MSRIYVTDCEGPLTKNDNAQELAAHFIPDGGAFFARLSRYDDFLADVLHKPGYNAGDTLRLLAPFLVAFGATDREVVDYSAENVLLVPGSQAALAEIGRLMPAYIISTSYTPYIVALCEVIGFPFDHCRCTALSLDSWQLPADEAARLREMVSRIAARPVIELPGTAHGLGDLSPDDQQAVRELDALFWGELQGTVGGELMAAVRPVGGGMKLAALEEIVRLEGCGADEVMYVGDSITDAPPLSAVKSWGGASVSFNGNAYALAAAELACAGETTQPVLELARAFAAGGAEGARALAHDRASMRSGQTLTQGVIGLVEERRAELVQLSAAAREQVRGAPVARLG